ncbi:MAG: glycosyltransferase [Bryobacterales bacterium]|nr:glycosyltransferase [Bryobacterales bacterium]
MTAKVAFVSCKDHLIAPFLERIESIYPELPLYVVAEFPPPRGKWIPYHPTRSLADNMARLKAALGPAHVRLSAAVLEPNTPYRRMRWMALRLSPRGFIAFNENLDHYMLRPRSAPVMARHLLWRGKNFLRWQLRPGGTAYTWAWRARHPSALRRPALYRAALLAGFAAKQLRRFRSGTPDPAPCPRPEGVSVVVPTRNGKDLVARLLPGVLADLPASSEVIVVDNGSDDATAEFLAAEYPSVRVEISAAPLSFAAAVNRGIRAARYSHVCLLNNDMIVERNFFAPLRRAFDDVPTLFCATAQILFPEGMRRQETGKAVWWSREENRTAKDFPVRCIEPYAGESGTYVLYGSGGCSMYDAAKMEQIGAFDELLAPAYVEDLDIGWRGWQRGWPTVYVGEAQVTHFHRSTTSRYYKPEMLQSFVEYNFLRFLARRIAEPAVFSRLWRDAVTRLNLLAIEQPWFVTWAQESLAFAWKATRLLQPKPEPLFAEDSILALGSGAVAVFPGALGRGRKRVLVVSPYIPFPLSHGGAVRIFNMMRCGAEDYDQILIAFVDDLGPVPEELKNICAEIVLVKRHPTHLLPDHGRPDVVEEYNSAAMRAAIRQMAAKWHPAVAQLEFTQMAQYAPDCAPARTVLVEHDITYDLLQQMLEKNEDWETRRQYERWVRFEKHSWHEVDHVVVMSEKDRGEAAAFIGPDKVTCLANGVDLTRFQSAGFEPEPRRLLFIGSFAHLPNILAMDFFLRECWPHLAEDQPVLHIIAGSRHRYFLERYQDIVRIDLDRPNIEIEDFVSDVRPAYERAAVVIAPLVASAGTNIKIMEAMAMGKAIVSTPAGINGLSLSPGRDVSVVQTGIEMAGAISRLLRDPHVRRAMEQEARLTVEREFDWSVIGRQQAHLYERLKP